MPTVTVQSILSKVKTLVQDVTGVRYPDAELIGWLNDAQLELAAIRPDSCSRLAPVPLVAGTLQAIPSDGSMLLKLTRNLGAGGATPGRAIRRVPMDLLDGQVPDWHSSTAGAVTQHFVFDERIPRQFYVYPPSLGTTQVEMLYASPPARAPLLNELAATYSQTGTAVTVTLANHGLQRDGWASFSPSTGITPAGFYRITAVTANTFTFAAATATTTGNATISSVISIDDVYSVSMIDYVAFRAYSKDDDMAGNADRAMAHRKLYMESLGAKSQADGSAVAAGRADTFGEKA